jgi:O-antigen/teichoic acid export membrane protein
MGIFGIFLGQTLAAGAFTAYAIYLGREWYRLQFDLLVLKRLLRYSLPLVPGTLTYFLILYVDRLTLNEFRGLDDVGVYGIGARLASVVKLFLTGFQGAWAPIVFSTFRESGAPDRFATVFRYYLFIVSAILIGLSFYSKEILLLLTTETFSRAYVVVPLLVLSAILASIAEYFTYGIQIAKKTHYRMLLNAAVLMLSLILNLALVPRFGIIGAALSGVISFTLLTIVAMRLSQRLYHIPHKWLRIGAGTLLAIVASNLVIIFGNRVSFAFVGIKFGIALLVLYAVARLLNVRIGAISRTIFKSRTEYPPQ